MGLIKAAAGAAGGVLADQWKEYFYCDSMPGDVLVTRAQKKTSGRSSNRRGSDNVISSGSVIAVSDGQCMLIVEQGKVVDFCAEPGEYTYDSEAEPSLFCGDLEDNIEAVFQEVGRRFGFGGEAPQDQRVYFVNIKEITGNKYGTPGPVPFRVVDANIGLDMDISVKCFGEYSYRITNPVLFYTNVCGNVEDCFTREELDGQLKSEVMTALQPAFAVYRSWVSATAPFRDIQRNFRRPLMRRCRRSGRISGASAWCLSASPASKLPAKTRRCLRNCRKTPYSGIRPWRRRRSRAHRRRPCRRRPPTRTPELQWLLQG